MKKLLFLLLSGAIVLSGCTYDVRTKSVRKHKVDGGQYPSIQQRTQIADQTCEAQYRKERQNFLSAVQTAIIRRQLNPNAGAAPLDKFRAEVNAAYNAVVMRCKTHTHCLEVKFYDEAACYMAASDRKDAERRFSDLSERLREIERELDKKVAANKKKKPGVKVSVETTVTQENDQSQTNDVKVGDDIADQDVLVLCGDAANLLDRRCRQ